jgi:hypothetical protein
LIAEKPLTRRDRTGVITGVPFIEALLGAGVAIFPVPRARVCATAIAIVSAITVAGVGELLDHLPQPLNRAAGCEPVANVVALFDLGPKFREVENAEPAQDPTTREKSPNPLHNEERYAFALPMETLTIRNHVALPKRAVPSVIPARRNPCI